MLVEAAELTVTGSDSHPPEGGIGRKREASAELERLRTVSEQFMAIERRIPLPLSELLHATAAGMHSVAASLSACEAVGVDREALAPFVSAVRAVHARSPLVQRLQNWPRGYPGDFETVEWLCDAQNRAPAATIEWAIEQCALQSPIAQQHRNKVGIQARAMLAAVVANPNVSIASIGCGGCRDLSLVQEFIPRGHGRFVLVDSDPDALSFARTRLPRLTDRCEFVVGKVPRVLSRLGAKQFDLVVAGGLFDYLPDRWAVATLRSVSRMLAPTGRMLFSNIAAGNPFRPWLEYLGEWNLIMRERGDVERLLAASGFSHEDLRIFHDSTGLAIIVDAAPQRG